MKGQNYELINTWADEARKGNKRAAELLLQTFRPLILKMAGSCMEDGGFEDAYQDGAVAFLEALKRYDPERNHLFPGYIRNYLDFYFRKRREGRFDKSVGALVSLDAPSAGDGSPLGQRVPDPVQPIQTCHEEHEKERRLKKLKQALRQLPGDQRNAVTAYYLKGQSQKAIAAGSQISQSAVKMRIHRGLRRLRVLMED
ncbi:sigma-70 family RNA polymerase sigma factor [Eubacterium sp. 1001713B170207_170306_E7]|uniref:sigma-70 family RNA polymerase sigma factor n=1 Tax=Eubacterium sp. 1001713B170207_170306_E7 TaxID=2787097 RepID=UPI0018990264|nr:sigma-70 family RNA polymerase sigma factor [Eubacterium sp. 1001713B170207_170306_E7]